MDYFRHYEKLCERAKNRTLEGYKEKHHIVPKCMGGGDTVDNIVELTAEEHYVAHQLLVKMYPNHEGLIFAAIRMTGDSNGNNRIGNKPYGWLRRKNVKVSSKLAKKRLGDKNGSFGTRWIYNVELEECKKICNNVAIPDGWKIGRVMNFQKRKEKILKKERIAEENKTKIIKELEPLYERYKKGETLTSVAKDYKYSFQSLHIKFKKYFPKVERQTGRGNSNNALDD